MILPIGDSPNPRSTPWITWALMAVNVAVFLALLPLTRERPSLDDPRLLEYLQAVAPDHLWQQVYERTSRYDLVLFAHGFRPGAPELADLLTSMFLHGGLAHLAGNMLFLWIFGNNVEHRLGHLGYAAGYLATGVAATLGDAALRAGSPIPAVGASGAISGVLGFYFLWFPANRVHLWVFLFPFFMDVIELPARLVLAMYVLIDNLLPLLVGGAGDGGVAYGAHLGGFVAGVVIAALVRVAHPHLEPGPWRPPEPEDLALTLRTALDDGRLGEAAGLVLAQPRPRTRRLPTSEVLRVGRALEDAGRAQEALAVYLRLLADHTDARARVDARLGCARLLLIAQPTLAYQHLRAALDERPDPAQEAEAQRLLHDLARWTRSLPRGRWRS